MGFKDWMKKKFTKKGRQEESLADVKRRAEEIRTLRRKVAVSKAQQRQRDTLSKLKSDYAATDYGSWAARKQRAARRFKKVRHVMSGVAEGLGEAGRRAERVTGGLTGERDSYNREMGRQQARADFGFGGGGSKRSGGMGGMDLGFFSGSRGGSRKSSGGMSGFGFFDSSPKRTYRKTSRKKRRRR